MDMQGFMERATVSISVRDEVSRFVGDNMDSARGLMRYPITAEDDTDVEISPPYIPLTINGRRCAFKLYRCVFDNHVDELRLIVESGESGSIARFVGMVGERRKNRENVNGEYNGFNWACAQMVANVPVRNPSPTNPDPLDAFYALKLHELFRLFGL